MLTINPSSSVGLMLHDAARSMRQAFDARARKLGTTRAQWRTLLYVARHQGATQSELADALDVERISAGRMVDRLVDAGLLERRADPADRRVWRLHLLPAAHGLVDRLTELCREIEAQALEALPEAERASFLAQLARLETGLRMMRERADTEHVGPERNVA